MAPEEPASLTILDIGDLGGTFEIHRWWPGEARRDLIVYFEAETCPDNFVAAAGGVVYVAEPPGYMTGTIEARTVDPPRYGWSGEVGRGGGLQVVAVIPTGLALDDPRPSPVTAKVWNGRVAVYWRFRDPGPVEVGFVLKALSIAPEEHCRSLRGGIPPPERELSPDEARLAADWAEAREARPPTSH